MKLCFKNLDNIMFIIWCTSLILILGFNQNIILNLLIIVSLILILSLLNENNLLRFLLYFAILSSFLLDSLWMLGRSFPININIKYMIDIINIILLFKILLKHKKYKLHNIFEDKILILNMIFIFISIFKLVIFNYSLLEFLNGIRVYLRFLPFYIIIKNNSDKKLLSDFRLIIILQIPILLVQMIRYTDQDQIGGMFGIYGQTYLFILLVPIFFYMLNKYLMKDVPIYEMILYAIVILGICAINETKVAFIIFPIVSVIMLILFNTRYSFIRKIFFMSIVAVSLIVSFKVLSDRYSTFNKFFLNSDAVIEYATKSNNKYFYFGRLENFNYIKDVELNSFSNNLLGIGIGRAVPDEFFGANHFNQGRTIKQIPLSSKYLQLQNSGYFLSSLNVFYFENGIIGILIYLLILLVLFKRCVSNIKVLKNINEISISYAFISLLITWIAMFYYNDIFYQYNTITIFWILGGLISKYYCDIKRNNHI